MKHNRLLAALSVLAFCIAIPAQSMDAPPGPWLEGDRPTVHVSDCEPEAYVTIHIYKYFSGSETPIHIQKTVPTDVDGNADYTDFIQPGTTRVTYGFVSDATSYDIDRSIL